MIILQYRTQPSLLRWTNDSITLCRPRGSRFPVSRFWLLFALQVNSSFPDTLLPSLGCFAVSFILLLALFYWILAYYRIAKQQWRHRIIDVILAVVICAMKPLCFFLPFQLVHTSSLPNVFFLTSIMIAVRQVHVVYSYDSRRSRHYAAQLLWVSLR